MPDALENLASQGNIEAQLELGRRCEEDGKSVAARVWFARAAKTGSATGLRLLGANLLTQEPVEGDQGVNMVRAAADMGDAEAAHICAMLAAGDSALPDRWEMARKCLEIAAERGFALAKAQLDFEIRMKPDTGARAQRIVFDHPRVSVIDNFAAPAECDWVIERARPLLGRALVYDAVSGGGMQREARSNSSMAFNIVQADLVLMRLRDRIEATSGINQLESTSILHYAPGQEFRPHFDFLDPARPGYARDLAGYGQRVATFLVYLNEGYEGGDTEFPKLGWRYKGRKGDALLFWNVDAQGEPDRRTLHAGLPPTSGEKWVFSQWLRAMPPRASG